MTQNKTRNQTRQKVYDGCKRARLGETEVYITLRCAQSKQLVRAKLASIDPKNLPVAEYALDYGPVVFMIHGEPMLVQPEGKDFRINIATGTMASKAFRKKILACVLEIYSRQVP